MKFEDLDRSIILPAPLSSMNIILLFVKFYIPERSRLCNWSLSPLHFLIRSQPAVINIATIIFVPRVVRTPKELLSIYHLLLTTNDGLFILSLIIERLF